MQVGDTVYTASLLDWKVESFSTHCVTLVRPGEVLRTNRHQVFPTLKAAVNHNIEVYQVYLREAKVKVETLEQSLVKLNEKLQCCPP